MKFEWHDSAAKRSVVDSPVVELTEADFYNLPIHTRTSKFCIYL